MNTQEFIKAKEEEFDEKYLSCIQEISIGQYDENGVNIGFLPSEKVIKNFLSQSLLEYNEKIKEIIEEAPPMTRTECEEGNPIDKDDIITKLTIKE